jgi:tetratricopeptide (TPR) repeat protein
MGMHDVAIHDFSNVLRIFPNHINAAFARAACYNAIGQFSRAIEDYNFALVKDQDSARVEKYDRRRANSLSSTRESAQSISSAYNANPDYLSDSNPASMSAQIVHSVESGIH